MTPRRNRGSDLTAGRREEITGLAHLLAELYSGSEGPVDLEYIIEVYGLGLSVLDYDRGFSGMLTCDRDYHFCIHVDATDNRHAVRKRFTIAHELGHFFIDEHRSALLAGVPPHYTKHTGYATHSLVEREADLFASALLVPADRLRRAYRNYREFSPKAVKTLARDFACSFPTMLGRIIDLDLHPLMRLTIRDGEIESYFFTPGFRGWLKDSRHVPEDSRLHDILSGDVSDGDAFNRTYRGFFLDWFAPPRWGAGEESTLFEYYTSYDGVIYGLLWEP